MGMGRRALLAVAGLLLAPLLAGAAPGNPAPVERASGERATAAPARPDAPDRATGGSASSPAAGSVLLLDIKGGIGPATRDYLIRSLKRAADQQAAAVVLRIDTPGGLDAATRDINQAILASDVPVIGWVAPQGARAASAGTYILYACHLAAMAPATSLGAATPVEMGGPGPARSPLGNEPPGGSGAGEHSDNPDSNPSSNGRNDDGSNRAPAAPAGSAMERKVVNDAAAYLRSLGELRGRNTDFADRAVREAATLTADQAVKQKVVEILAADIDSLLTQADGRLVALQGGRRATLATGGAPVVTVEPDWRFQFLSVLTNPSVAYMLLLVGMYGLIFEGYSPGAVLPGVVGAICLLLALYALQVLPVNYAGVALIMLGVALMATEFAVPSFGALGIGGVVALVIGSLILFDTEVPGYGVPGQLVTGIGLASALAFMGLIWLAARARRQPVTTGVEELLGEPAVALEDFQGHGRVQIRGETWQAESTYPVSRGQALRVLAVNGLVLLVAPSDMHSPDIRPSNGVPT